MTTRDLQRIDELVHVSDIAVRVGSQLRLWCKRGELRDAEAVNEGIRFLQEAVNGGRFVNSGGSFAGSASLSPFTWSVDVKLAEQGSSPLVDGKDVEYGEYVRFLDDLRTTLESVVANSSDAKDRVLAAAIFFDHLGQFLGTKADNAMQIPFWGGQFMHDRMSLQ